MRKAAGLLCAIFLLLEACAKPPSIPLPEKHPAYGFYQTANAFNVSAQSCLKLKGILEIRPDKIGTGQGYEKVKELAPGLFVVKDENGHQWVTVFFYGVWVGGKYSQGLLVGS